MDRVMQVKLDATEMRNGRWAVRPEGRCGTCGFYPCAWTVQYINARSADEAVRKAKPLELEGSTP